jgi:glycerol-3-phosphate cytidylyltransferase-like family protein
MGRMKELAIQQEEQRLEYLYEKYYIEAALIQAEEREEAEMLVYEEMLLDEQVKQDKEENQNE